MKTFLNFFWQFGEINLRDSGFRLNDDAIGLDARDRRVFVLLTVDGCEVLGKTE